MDCLAEPLKNHVRSLEWGQSLTSWWTCSNRKNVMPVSFHRRTPLTLLDPARVCSDRGIRALTFEAVPDVIAAKQELSQKEMLAFWQMTQPRPTHTLRVSAAAAQSSVSLVSERALTFLRRRLQSPAALHCSTATDSRPEAFG